MNLSLIFGSLISILTQSLNYNVFNVDETVLPHFDIILFLVYAEIEFWHGNFMGPFISLFIYVVVFFGTA
jgi:hypothetical protein